MSGDGLQQLRGRPAPQRRSFQGNECPITRRHSTTTMRRSGQGESNNRKR